MSTGKFLIVVGGPTASGKTSFAIRLAQHFDTAIVSADSRQFFREMNIGTAKPSSEELTQAKHYLIGHRSVEEEYSVGEFEREALAILEDLFKEQDIVILAGGSGLYIKALCEGLDDLPVVSKPIKEQIEQEYLEKGLVHLQQELARIDPEHYERVDHQNPHRLMRAIAVYRASGQPFSSFHTQESRERFFTPIYLQLHWPRKLLYQRIDERVEKMIEAGLLDEARALYPRRQLTALQTVGYQELFDYQEGKTSLLEAIALIQRNSRRYAKRQLTWFRRDGHWKLLKPPDWKLALRYIDGAMTKGWRLQYHETASLGSVFSIADKNRRLQIESPEGVICHLDYSERKKEVLLRGPWPGEGFAAELLAHEGLLAAEGKPAYIFSLPGSELMDKAGYQEVQRSMVLPSWVNRAWADFLEQHSGAVIKQMAGRLDG